MIVSMDHPGTYVGQLLEHLTSKLEVVCLSPALGIQFFLNPLTMLDASDVGYGVLYNWTCGR